MPSLTPKIHATTAQFPGLSWRLACEKIHAGFSEPFWGVVSTDHVQICPQTFGQVTKEVAEELTSLYPKTKFRLHANARVLPKHVIFDASTVDSDTLPYFEELFARQRDFKSACMSVHAGYKKNCSENFFWSNIDTLRSLASSFGTEVCIEGLYPNEKMPQWIDCWLAYESLLKRDIPFALDLSHLKIVGKKEGWSQDIALSLISSPLCREIHVSENDGRSDRHEKTVNSPVWMSLLESAYPDALIFSEGRMI